jgi:uncharacterized protein (DUF58 family)
MPANSPSANMPSGLRSFAQNQWRHIDRPGWRRFFLALLGLAVSFFLALYATALHDAGRYELAAAFAALSLLLAGAVGVRSVPYLARRTALERWILKIEYEFTREGGIYLVIIVIIAIAALNTGNNLLFMILACLLAGILVSGVVSQIVLTGLELELELPEHLFAGLPTTLRLTLRNLKWALPSFSITAGDRSSVKSLREADVRARASGQEVRRILRRQVYIPYLGRRSSASAQVDVTFPHRGRYTQEGFRVSTGFPFALLRKSREVPLRREVLVLPNIQPTEEFYEILPLISGEVESLHKGRGHDLYAIRDYQQTDPARHVDWKATAKLQQLKVREFAREDERRVALVFDTRLPAVDDPMLARFEKAVTFCACLAWHFYEINAQMRFISENLETSMVSAGDIVYPVLESLALVEPVFAAGSPASPVLPSDSGRDILARLPSAPGTFNIILTFLPRGSIPTSLWGSSYVVFGDVL